jgi:DivIVA domain-containing protein
VPASGPLTGEDLRRVRFSLAFRGYRMSEVDALLDRMATDLELRQSSEAADEGEQPPTSEGRGGEPTD